jgi:hypothetical protein
MAPACCVCSLLAGQFACRGRRFACRGRTGVVLRAPVCVAGCLERVCCCAAGAFAGARVDFCAFLDRDRLLGSAGQQRVLNAGQGGCGQCPSSAAGRCSCHQTAPSVHGSSRWRHHTPQQHLALAADLDPVCVCFWFPHTGGYPRLACVTPDGCPRQGITTTVWVFTPPNRRRVVLQL